jgi:hypothetical protein
MLLSHELALEANSARLESACNLQAQALMICYMLERDVYFVRSLCV